MFTFILGIVLTLIAVTSFKWTKYVTPSKLVRLPVSVVGIIIGLIMIVWSTTLYVGPTQGGEITRKFGKSLPSGRIIAIDHGEKGPQARVLSPGWHFFYWPWMYKLEPIANIEIKEGMLGIVRAYDGAESLAKGEIYAAEWDDPTSMLDGERFMKEGTKGPQLTVLTPGQYRYNSKLFNITPMLALNVRVGSVAVIKDNAGPVYEPIVSLETNVVKDIKGNETTNIVEVSDIEVVNGTPIVPQGYRGIWNKALTPQIYYLHPNAYEVKFVQTVKRVYAYTGAATVSTKSDRPTEDNSIRVRTVDAYSFPVDVRASVKVTAKNAPYIVALLGDPDGDLEKDGFDVLEEMAVLPSLRSIFRNSAEDKKALVYVNSRSEVELSSTKLFKADMLLYKVDVDSVYVADIGLDKTPEGKLLLKTQTDKELALNEQETYQEQVKSQNQRALVVKATEAADQNKQIQASLAQVEIKENWADARKKEALGVAEYNDKVIESLGGVEAYMTMEVIKMMIAGVPTPDGQYIGGWKGEVPQQMVVGSGEGLNTAVLGKMLSALSKAPISK